jgi:hypothetical protein
MPLISGGGGGGTPFNGGTIHNPLVVADNGTQDSIKVTGRVDGSKPGLFVSSPSSQETNPALVVGAVDTGVGGNVAIARGIISILLDLPDSPAIVISPAALQTEWQVRANDSAATGSSGISADAYLITAKHAAPPDAALTAGDCALWFDQTNGAAKFMVKAKTADGTVVSAAIALS